MKTPPTILSICLLSSCINMPARAWWPQGHGILAHYAGDICMPLHTTVDYDGRVTADGRSPHSGIHAKVDSLIEKLPLRPEDLAAGQKIEPLAEVATDRRDNRAPLMPGLFPL